MLNPHLNEKNIQISSQISTESLDFSTWQRKVVWYGHRSGAYLKTFHTIINLEDLDILAKIPGHF
jgi:hypothetical protein